MNGPRRWAGAMGWIVASWSAVAGASDLSWSGPPECRESEQLSFQVERALGAPLADIGHVHLQVHIARVSPDARALLRIASDEGGAPDAHLKERLLVAPNCATLVDTLAVAIALVVEAEAPAVEQTPASAGTTSHSAAPASEPPRGSIAVISAPMVADAARAAEPDPARAALAPSVGALLVADVGSLPQAALGTAFGVALGGARWQLELLGTFWFEQHTVLGVSSVAGAGADVNLATGALLGCANPFGAGAQALNLSLCAGLELGRLSGTGAGVNRPRGASALWLAPSLQAELTLRVPGSRLSLNARAGVALPLDRDQFVLDRLGTVHQPSSLAARAGLGVAVALE